MELSAKIFGSALCFCLFLVSQLAFCDVKLPRLVSNGMVLQRDADVRIWGWANAGEKVIVKFNGKPVTDFYDLPRLLAEDVIGKETNLEILRGEKLLELAITPIASEGENDE